MTHSFSIADAAHLPLADKSVDLVLGSPPYMDARSYSIDAQRGCQEWIDWMLEVTTEAVRVSRGMVIWVCAGVTRDWCYWPGPEGLLYEWWKRGGRCWRPCYWHRVGIPGSGGKQWMRADVEYCLAFTGEKAAIPWADNRAMGHVPKYGPGGAMSNRTSSGERINQWGHSLATGGISGTKDDVTCGPPPSHYNANASIAGQIWGGGGTSFGRKNNGEKIPPAGSKMRGTSRKRSGEMKPALKNPMPIIANHGNWLSGDDFTIMLDIVVGGGLMGDKHAHKNEAPYPEKLAEFFIRSLAPVGGIVCDPFSGSGTTVCVAAKHDRIGIGFDIRESQCVLGAKRLKIATTQGKLFAVG